jgi:polyvinyl alcohol dehydrogenase (cytochrome)
MRSDLREDGKLHHKLQARVPTVVSFLLCIGLYGTPALQAEETPAEVFNNLCVGCHNANPPPRAMSGEALHQLAPEKIFFALDKGLMSVYTYNFSQERKRALAEFISTKPWSAAQSEVREELHRCATSSPLPADAFDHPHWSGWGIDLDNTRFQPVEHAKLDRAALAKLELRWVFAFPNAATIGTQPAVVGGRLFIGSPANAIYSLDAKTGCAHWKFDTRGTVRATISVLRVPSSNPVRYTVYAADRAGWVYALDANTGERLWEYRVDDHRDTAVTASPVVHKGRVYVAASSFEEVSGAFPKYECCTFRGSVTALDAQTGKRLWKTYVIPEEPKPTKKNSVGTQLYGPSGAGVWSAPTIDEKRGLLYVTTGDGYSPPAAATSDAVVALELETGAIRWVKQTTSGDAFTLACETPAADPISREKCGPDIDYGASAVLRKGVDGHTLLLAGQKSGVLHALDPDKKGELVWTRRLSPGGVIGGIEWGFATDEQVAYVPISDMWENRATPQNAGGVYAVRIADGEVLWKASPPTLDCLEQAGCNAAQPQAATLIPGIVFVGSLDGHMRAYDTKAGEVIWKYDSKRNYEAVNGLPANGGSLNGAGVTVVDGWLYFTSGYGFSGMPGNVLLAFGPPKGE